MIYKNYKKKIAKNKISCGKIKKKNKLYNKILYSIIAFIVITSAYLILYDNYIDYNEYNKHKPINVKIAKRWRYIIIHHSATKEGNAEIFDRFHKQKYNKGLLYHFVIGNGNGSPDGKPEIGNRWVMQQAGGHVSVKADHYNQAGIGISLVGNFNEEAPTKKQMDILIKLTKFLMNRFNITPENVLFHKDANETDCPGKLFPYEEFKVVINSIPESKVYSANNLNQYNKYIE